MVKKQKGGTILIRTDEHIYQAVEDWFNNRDEAEYIYGHISDWDTSAVTNMQSLFYDQGDFNDDISNWNVSNVTNMNSMFWKASSFNQPIGGWDTKKVTTMEYMFYDARSFNQPIGEWDTENVTNMNGMFMKATSFNQPIGKWNTINVIIMDNMFKEARSFNQDLTPWYYSVIEIIGYPITIEEEERDIFYNSGMIKGNYPRNGIQEKLRLADVNRVKMNTLLQDSKKNTLLHEVRRDKDKHEKSDRREQAFGIVNDIARTEERKGNLYTYYERFGGKKRRKSLKKKMKISGGFDPELLEPCNRENIRKRLIEVNNILMNSDSIGISPEDALMQIENLIPPDGFGRNCVWLSADRARNPVLERKINIRYGPSPNIGGKNKRKTRRRNGGNKPDSFDMSSLYNALPGTVTYGNNNVGYAQPNYNNWRGSEMVTRDDNRLYRENSPQTQANTNYNTTVGLGNPLRRNWGGKSKRIKSLKKKQRKTKRKGRR